MSSKILIINPVGTDRYDEDTLKYLNKVKQSNTIVDVISLKHTPCEHLTDYYYGALIATELLNVIKRAEKNGYDAAVIGCYYDPLLREAREICENMIVVAPAEASIHIATTLGHKFATLIVNKKCIPGMEETILKMGVMNQFVGFYDLSIGVSELQSDPDATEKKQYQMIQKAIGDGAEVITLGCTIQFGHYESLQREFGVPVIDAIIAPFKYAEFLVELKRSTGWYFSQINTYKTPNLDEIKSWNIEEAYGAPGIWS